MIIRKQFKFNGMHIVRDCSTDRCKKSLHSHTYTVELMLTSSLLDNGGMVMDFGLTKSHIKNIIESFNNSYSLWVKEKDVFKNIIKLNNSRWIEMPCSPTAEMYAVMFYAIINKIIKKTEFNNGEKDVELLSVRVHETDTGWAEADQQDYINIWLRGGYSINNIIFSDGIKKEWKDPQMWEKLLSDEDITFYNPKVDLLYKETK